MMTLAARRAARYRGLPSHHDLLNRWYRSVAAEVWRRAVHMIRSCLPGSSATAEFLFTGEADWPEDDTLEEAGETAFESDDD